MQNAPQETEIESYVINNLKQDVKKDQFKNLNYNDQLTKLKCPHCDAEYKIK